jgi:hypothetical protein
MRSLDFYQQPERGRLEGTRDFTDKPVYRYTHAQFRLRPAAGEGQARGNQGLHRQTHIQVYACAVETTTSSLRGAGWREPGTSQTNQYTGIRMR